jgi:hypothetical protein
MPVMAGKPRGDRALSAAERSAAYRLRVKANAGKPPRVVYRRPADRRSKPRRWADAIAALTEVLDGYQQWRDSLPPGLTESAIAARLDDVLALRDLVEQLADPDLHLPKGFGRARGSRLCRASAGDKEGHVRRLW